MRRLLAALLILCLLLAMAGASSWWVNRFTGALADQLEDAEALAEQGDWASACAVTQAAQAEYERASELLYIVLRHTDMDAIASGFRQVLEFIEWEELGEYSAANAELIAGLELLGEMEQLTLKNLL